MLKRWRKWKGVADHTIWIVPTFVVVFVLASTIALFDSEGRGTKFKRNPTDAERRAGVLSIEDYWVYRGTFGDMFGGANALFAAFTVIGLAVSIMIQRREAQGARDEMTATLEIASRNADAATRLALATETMYRESTRPYVLTDKIEIIHPNDLNTPFKCKVLFKNFGKAPAVKLATHVRMHLTTGDPHQELQPIAVRSESGYIPPDSLIHNIGNLGATSYYDFVYFFNSNPDAILICEGYARYSSVTGESFITLFRQHLTNESVLRGYEFTVSETGNEIFSFPEGECPETVNTN